MVALSLPFPSSSLSLSLLSPRTLTIPPPVPRLTFYKPRTLSSSFPPLRSLRPISASPLPLDSLPDLKDWSFLDSSASDPNWPLRAGRAIAAAGEITPGSRVLVCMGTVAFVGRVAESCAESALVAVHDSLLELALVKEMHDRVRCWQGGVAAVPERMLPLDVVFICYFPGMGISIEQLLGSVAQRCSPGARLVICFDQGREAIQQDHRQKYPDMVTADLPDRTALEKAAKDQKFQITELVDEPNFYLAALRLDEPKT